jgi:hypothetical protein
MFFDDIADLRLSETAKQKVKRGKAPAICYIPSRAPNASAHAGNASGE